MPAHRDDIDGLRALAIVPVMLFHAGFGAVSGGFVGVDVFFVISGYLITGILVRPDQPGAGLAEFYERRVRRIVPALFVVALACAIAAWIWLQPDQMMAFAATLALLPVFASNVRIWKQSGYFAPAAETLPLLHTWSLAVEEQFYLVFPLVLWAIRRFGGGRTLVWLGALAALSLGAAIWGTQHSPAIAFYSAHTRAFELLAGALVACGLLPLARQQALREALAALGLALVLWPVFAWSAATPFPGPGAVPPVLGAALLIHTGSSGDSFVRRLLSLRPLVAIGLVSYSLYLWHWPLLAFAQIASPEKLDIFARAGLLGLSAGLAWLTNQYVETPFRRRTLLAGRKPLLIAGALCGLALGGFGLGVMGAKGVPQRIPLAIRAQVLANAAMPAELAYPKNCGKNYRHILAAGEAIVLCALDTGAPKNILFWGDSQMEQLFPLLSELAQDKALPGWNLTMATSGGCLPVPGFNINIAGFDCGGFNSQALARATGPQADIIVMASAPYDITTICLIGQGCQPFADRSGYAAALHEKLNQQLRQLKAAGKQIVVILPFPSYPVAVPVYLNRMLARGKAPELALTREQHLAQTKLAGDAWREAAQDFDAITIDPSDILCPKNLCLYQENGLSLYIDGGHIGARAAGWLRPALLDALRQAGAGTLP